MHGADNKSRSETTNPDTLGNLQTEYSCHDFERIYVNVKLEFLPGPANMSMKSAF